MSELVVHGGPYKNTERFMRQYPGMSLGDALQADLAKARRHTRATGPSIMILVALALWAYVFAGDVSPDWIVAAKVIALLVGVSLAIGWFQAWRIGRPLSSRR